MGKVYCIRNLKKEVRVIGNAVDSSKLVRRAVNGDQSAFIELVDLYRRSMYATAVAVTHNENDALDAIQDTILILWEKLSTLRRPDLFKTWMTRILVNRCCSLMRKGCREMPSEILREEEQEQREWDTSLDVREALQRVSEDDRLILQLFYFEDFSLRQIAQILSITPNAAKMRLSRSRKRFLEQYETEAQYERS